MVVRLQPRRGSTGEALPLAALLLPVRLPVWVPQCDWVGLEGRMDGERHRGEGACPPVEMPVGFEPATVGFARQAASTDHPVLLLGETGTGKGYLARIVHAWSRRANGPFITAACPAIPRDIFEAELFGHERGAFTGAIGSKPGLFEMAHGGTLLLDEVGDLHLPLQAKLLQVLDNASVRRLGGTRARQLDIRIIAATNRPLRQMRDGGTFRSDLFYRLNVFTHEALPLRRRSRPVLRSLIDALLAQIAQGPDTLLLAPDAYDALLGYSWPGNTRELGNVLRYGVTSAVGGEIRLDAVCIDSDGLFWQQLGLSHTPVTVLLRDGVIVYMDDAPLASEAQIGRFLSDVEYYALPSDSSPASRSAATEMR